MPFNTYDGRHKFTVRYLGKVSRESYPEKADVWQVCISMPRNTYSPCEATIVAHPDGTFRHSYGATRRPIYGNSRTLAGAVREVMRSRQSWIGYSYLRSEV